MLVSITIVFLNSFAGLNSSSSYSNTSGGASQYSNYNSGSNHKLGKDSSGYESGSAVVSSATATTSASSSALSTTAGSKTTTTSGKLMTNTLPTFLCFSD